MRSLLALALVVMTGASFVAATEYVAEVLFVVEPQVVRNYQNLGYDEATAISTISTDIDYFIYQMNIMFGSLGDFELNIQVRAKHVEFVDPTKAMFPDGILIRGSELQSDMAMEKFKEWLNATNAHNTFGYDMAIVWTGYNLFGKVGNSQMIGYASVGATCDATNAVSVVEFDGTMATAITTAHEIGHILGAPHVSDDPSSSCSSQDGFIMSSETSPTNKKRWSFSSCTADAMLLYISTLSPNCLIETTAPASLFQMTDVTNADILDVEKICQRKRKTANAYFAHFSDFYTEAKGDEVCQRLMCADNGTNHCWPAIPSDGMMCDDKKRCDKGRCVASSIPTGDIDPTCVFGDIESENIYGPQTCQDFVSVYVGRCYTEWVSQERCCATCNAKKLDIEGCEYGDRNPVCKLYTRDQVCPASSAVCCETCHGYVGKRSIRRDSVDLPESAKVFAPPHAVDDEKNQKKQKGPTISD